MADPAEEKASFGLIAGAGALPFEALRCLEERGVRAKVIAFEGVTDPSLAPAVPRHAIGRLGAVLETLGEAAVERLLIVGAFDRGKLAAGASFEPDELARGLLARVANASDVGSMATLALWLEERSLRLCRQDEWLSDLLAGIGPIGSTRPTEAVLADVTAGLAALSVQSPEEIGQAVAVEDGRILVREGKRGTDVMIREAGERSQAGFTVVKAARPAQDARLDLPAIGPATIQAMKQAGAKAIAVEGAMTLMIERARVRALADAAGIVVWGFDRGQPRMDDTDVSVRAGRAASC